MKSVFCSRQVFRFQVFLFCHQQHTAESKNNRKKAGKEAQIEARRLFEAYRPGETRGVDFLN